MNKFDFWIIFMASSLIFGQYGGAFQPIRIISVVFLLLNMGEILGALKKDRYLGVFSVFFIIYGFISLLFNLDNIGISLNAYIYFLVNIFLLLSMICCLNNAKKPMYSLLVGISIFSFFSIGYGIYEINTGNHLAVNLMDSDVVESLQLRSYSSFTFGNYNMFVMSLMMMMSLLVISFKLRSDFLSSYIRILFFFMILGMTYIIIINGSRSGVVVVFMCIFYLFANSKKVALNVLFGIIFTVIFVLFKNSLVDLTIYNRFLEQGIHDEGRYSILIDVFPLFFDEGMKGFGLGGFSYVVSRNLSGLVVYAPHNFFLEILYELGIFSFILFIVLLVRSLSNKISLFLVMVFIPFSIINSGYLLVPMAWFFLALIHSCSKWALQK